MNPCQDCYIGNKHANYYYETSKYYKNYPLYNFDPYPNCPSLPSNVGIPACCESVNEPRSANYGWPFVSGRPKYSSTACTSRLLSSDCMACDCQNWDCKHNLSNIDGCYLGRREYVNSLAFKPQFMGKDAQICPLVRNDQHLATSGLCTDPDAVKNKDYTSCNMEAYCKQECDKTSPNWQNKNDCYICCMNPSVDNQAIYMR